jgi:putative SOS response-associated peptidase YedK
MSHPVDSPRLHSHPAEDMDCYRVSKLVNNARNDSPECIKAA